MLERAQSPAEEVANSLSHAAGAVAASLVTPVLVSRALESGVVHAIGAAVYGVSLFLLFFVSAAYHWLPTGRNKALFQRLDHAAIYVMIAGSYTPFMLGALADDGGHNLLAGVWTVAVVGSALKCVGRLTHPVASTLSYLALGWAALLMVAPMIRVVPAGGLTLIAVGGACYTLGAVVFHFDTRIRFAHFFWHLLVLAGAGCHLWATLLYAVR